VALVRRDAGENYEEFLRELAKASGIAPPTREDLGRLDRKRKKQTANKEWKSPADGDARRLSRRIVTTDRETLRRKLSRAEIKGVSVTSADLPDVERFS
jgi:hypothetical protein